jgi:hypothetical protein
MKLETPIRKERAYEKYSWVLLLGTPFLLGVLGVQGLIYGYSSYAPVDLFPGAVTGSTPASTVNLLNYVTRGAAGGTLVFTVLLAVIAVTSYRKGARWAWFIEFYYFMAALAAVAMEVAEGQNDWIGVLILGVPWLLGLFLPYREFFPKRPRLT